SKLPPGWQLLFTRAAHPQYIVDEGSLANLLEERTCDRGNRLSGVGVLPGKRGPVVAQADRIVDHQYLAVTFTAGAYSDRRNGQGLRDLRPERGWNVLQHEHERAGRGDIHRLILNPPRLIFRPANLFEILRGLWCQSRVSDYIDSIGYQVRDYFELRAL